MNVPESSQARDTTPDFLATEEASPKSTIAKPVRPGHVYQNSATSENARAHYGDHIIYGDSHIHHHLPYHGAARPAPPRRPINTLEWRKDPHFVGREDTLAGIKQGLIEHASVALTGTGGIGKSQTAIEFCWRWLEEKPHFHVFWMYAASIQAYDTCCGQLARKLRLDCSSPVSSKTDVRNGVKDWLEDNADWLMVVDNADARNSFEVPQNGDTKDSIREFLPLPRAGQSMILYTSRHASIGQDLTEGHCFPLGNLSMTESMSLLRKKLGRSISDNSAVAILKALEFLPMSIAHAAAYMKFTKIPVEQYLGRLASDEGLLELLDTHHVDVGRRNTKAPRSVVKALLTTLDLLSSYSRPALGLFYFMVCLDRQNIPWATLTTGVQKAMRKVSEYASDIAVTLPTSQTALEIAMGELESLALVSRRPGDQSFAVHRLVQAITTQRMTESGRLGVYSNFSAICLIELYLPNHAHHLDYQEEKDLYNAGVFIPSIQRVHQLMKKAFDKGYRGPNLQAYLLYKMGIYFFARREPLNAIACFADALRLDLDPEPREQTALLQCMCLPPPEAVALATKFNLRIWEIPLWQPRPEEDWDAHESLVRLEKLSLQASPWSSFYPGSMCAGTTTLARAIAAVTFDTARFSTTTPPLATTIPASAQAAADGMIFEQSDFLPENNSNDPSSATTSSQDRLRFHESACKELASQHGTDDLNVLGYRLYLAEMRGRSATATKELRDIEHSLQAVYDRMTNTKDVSPKHDIERLQASHYLGRVKAISYQGSMGKLPRKWHPPNNLRFIFYSHAERMLLESLAQVEKQFGLFSMETIKRMRDVQAFLKCVRSTELAGNFAIERATSLTEALSDGKLLGRAHDALVVTIMSMLLEFEDRHCLTACEKLLLTSFNHVRVQRARLTFFFADVRFIKAAWRALKAIQTQQTRSSESRPFANVIKLFQHNAWCDWCNELEPVLIIGIRHKCLRCANHNVCTSCLALDIRKRKPCPSAGTPPGPHRFAPLFEQYGDNYVHREMVVRIGNPPIETHLIPRALCEHPETYFVIPIHQRWHKVIADDKGYESEPDEGRRTETQYLNHCARRKVDGFDGWASRARSRSYESLKLAFSLTRP